MSLRSAYHGFVRRRSRILSWLREWRLPQSPLRFNVLRWAGSRILPEYRFKWPQVGWWQDQKFTAYLRRFGELGCMNADRRWMVSQLARLIDSVPGDTAECGAYQGASSYLICSAIAASANKDRTHFVFDSFEGLSQPGSEDGQHWSRGGLACDIETVSRNLAEFQGVQLVKGWIPERFSEVADRQFAFVHIDVDLYQPTRDSIEFFYPRLAEGGILIFDDYGSTICPGATRAVDEFLADKPEQAISLCCIGGFIIKGRPTAKRGPGGLG